MKRKFIFLMLAALFAPLAMNAQQSLPYSYGFENYDLSADGWTTANPYSMVCSLLHFWNRIIQSRLFHYRHEYFKFHLG